MPTSLDPIVTLKKLQDFGYFKYVPESDKEAALKLALESLGTGLLSIDLSLYETKKIPASLDRRRFGIDGEALAEGGIRKTLQNMYAEVLSKEGVPSLEVEQKIGSGDGYKVVVNNKLYEIYSESDISSAPIWQMSLVGLMRIVNDLLSDVGSQERLYGIHADNDGAAIFLTAELYQFFIETGINMSDYSVKPRTAEELLS